MTINWWTLGLQAINVLILVWLLTHVFWRPVANAIARRQEAVEALLNNAKASKSDADSALAEVTKTRAGLAKEREALLASAATEAEAAAKAKLAEASVHAERILASARLAGRRETESAHTKTMENAAQLAVDIAQKLLTRLDSDKVQAAFLDHLIKAIEQIKPKDRAALSATEGGLLLVSPNELKAAEKAEITKVVSRALGGKPVLSFVTDADLIAGLEIRSTHFVLGVSWQSDLASIMKDLKNAV